MTTFKRVSTPKTDDINSSLRDAENKLTEAEDRVTSTEARLDDLEASTVDLTSEVTGTLPVANGGTGAVTLTGVLTGNGTGAVTGSVVGMVLAEYTKADVTSQSTTPADVSGLSVTLVTGGIYDIRFAGNAEGASTGVQFRLGGTVSATYVEASWQIIEDGNPLAASIISERESAIGGGVVTSTTVVQCAELHGTVQVATGGTLTIQFARNGGSGTATLYKGASLIAMRMA